MYFCRIIFDIRLKLFIRLSMSKRGDIFFMNRLIKTSFILSTVFLVSCQAMNNDVSAPPANEQQLIHVKNTNPTDQGTLTNDEIATHLSNIAGQIKDVNDAASIVIGPYAVVGIDVAEDLDRQRVGTVKYTVTEALRNDPYGKTAVVIADADLMERFRKMGEEIQNGRPVRGVIEELAEIVNRYIPDMPVEEIDINDDRPNDNLHDNDQERLRNIQEEQSNDIQ